jgi:LysM repeat protein
MTLRNFSLDLDEATFQAAVERAQAEGKSLEQVLTEYFTSYAREGAAGPETTYTVQKGDTLATIARNLYGDPYQYPYIQQANNITDPGRIWVGQTLIIPPLPGGETPPSPAPPVSAPTPEPAPKPEPGKPGPAPKVDPCQPIAGASYVTLPIVGPATDRAAAEHADINLALRAYSETESVKGLIDMGGPTDQRAPQLAGLFGDQRTPEFKSVYRANNWDWGSNSRADPVTDFEVTVAGFAVEPGETIHVPDSGYSIGQGQAVLVLFATDDQITLKYTGEDNVVYGYTIHVDGVCVDPVLQDLYKEMNNSGRGHLPALKASQAFGRASGNEIRIAIRDTGRFMDPRVRKDWWRGR